MTTIRQTSDAPVCTEVFNRAWQLHFMAVIGRDVFAGVPGTVDERTAAVLGEIGETLESEIGELAELIDQIPQVDDHSVDGAEPAAAIVAATAALAAASADLTQLRPLEEAPADQREARLDQIELSADDAWTDAAVELTRPSPLTEPDPGARRELHLAAITTLPYPLNRRAADVVEAEHLATGTSHGIDKAGWDTPPPTRSGGDYRWGYDDKGEKLIADTGWGPSVRPAADHILNGSAETIRGIITKVPASAGLTAAGLFGAAAVDVGVDAAVDTATGLIERCAAKAARLGQKLVNKFGWTETVFVALSSAGLGAWFNKQISEWVSDTANTAIKGALKIPCTYEAVVVSCDGLLQDNLTAETAHDFTKSDGTLATGLVKDHDKHLSYIRRLMWTAPLAGFLFGPVALAAPVLFITAATICTVDAFDNPDWLRLHKRGIPTLTANACGL